MRFELQLAADLVFRQAGDAALEGGLVSRPVVVRHDQVADGAAERRRPRVAEHGHRGLVELQHPAVAVGDDDGADRRGDDRRFDRLAGDQALLVFLLAGDVDHAADESIGLCEAQFIPVPAIVAVPAAESILVRQCPRGLQPVQVRLGVRQVVGMD